MSDNLKFEQLEERRLLAVSVTTGKQGLLKITSDGEGDEVDVVGTGTLGEVDVYVDGGFVGTFSGIKTIKATMKGGDDDFGLDAVQIGGAVTVDMGAGADTFDLDTFNEFDDVDANVFIGGSVIAKMGNNPGDFVDWDADDGGEGTGITIGNNVTLIGAADVDLDGEGGGFGVQNTDINIGGFLKISSNIAGDDNGDGHNVDIDDVNVGGTTILSLGGADDDVQVSDSSFARRVAVSLGGGDDFIDNGEADGANRFGAEVVLNGGAGDDTLDEGPGNVYAVAPVVNGIETIV